MKHKILIFSLKKYEQEISNIRNVFPLRRNSGLILHELESIMCLWGKLEVVKTGTILTSFLCFVGKRLTLFNKLPERNDNH